MARPIVVIDTSVFLKDAFSKTRVGAASQVLAILPAVAGLSDIIPSLIHLSVLRTR